MKKTKIICSIGPVSSTPNVMEQMVRNGMNVARINFSHATVEEINQYLSTIEEVRKRTGVHVAILYDTKGPDFRCGIMPDDGINLINGNTIRIVKEDIIGSEDRFTVNHKECLDKLREGDIILLEDGLMKLVVVSIDNNEITCNIVDGGILKSKKGMNVPGVNLDIPFMSDQDLRDIICSCENNGDFLALSFVQSKENIALVRKILAEHNRSDMKIISKVESHIAIENLDEIIEASDGIMVARGDLGVEIPMQELPIIQKEMIRKCREYGKFVIVATEMLASMYTNARPTRAEVTDISNAVFDGTDAVMLSGETTIGKHPVEAVKFMADICETTEAHTQFGGHFISYNNIDITETIARGVVESAELLNAKLIVAATMSGYTARKISNLKPNQIILATCPNEKVARSLALNWGVYTVATNLLSTTDDIINDSIAKAKGFVTLNKGDIVVVTGGFPTVAGGISSSTNLMKIEVI